MTAPPKPEKDAAEAAMSDDDLRDALTANDGNNAVAILKNKYGITFSDPNKAVDIINKHVWKDLNILEGLLGRKLEDDEAHPLSA